MVSCLIFDVLFFFPAIFWFVQKLCFAFVKVVETRGKEGDNYALLINLLKCCFFCSFYCLLQKVILKTLSQQISLKFAEYCTDYSKKSEGFLK